MDNYIESVKRWSAQRGQENGVEYAEAFSPHRGHPHPQDDIVSQLLSGN